MGVHSRKDRCEQMSLGMLKIIATRHKTMVLIESSVYLQSL